MRRFLLAAMMFGAVSGAQAADMPDLPILARRFHRRADREGQLAGLLHRRPGRLRIVRREFQRLDPNHDRGIALPTPSLKARWGFRDGISGSARPRHAPPDSAASSDITRNGTTSSSASKRATCTARLAARSTGERSPLHSVTACPMATSTMSRQRRRPRSRSRTWRRSAARAGYAFGCFLPYVFGGFALGNADISRTVTRPGRHDSGADEPAGSTACFLEHDGGRSTII